MSLRKRGFGYRRTSRVLNLSKNTVHGWWLGKKPDRNWNYFVPKPSNDMAYVLGVLFGDAYLINDKRCRFIELKSKDIAFVEKFSSCLSRLLRKENGWKIQTLTHAGRRYFKVRIGSTRLCDFLSQKLIKFKKLITHNESTMASFVRGFSDSEGWPSRHWGKICVDMANTNRDVLEYVVRLLGKLGIESRIYTNKERRKIFHTSAGTFVPRKICYRLWISKRKSVKRFGDLIGFSIQRKQEIFKEGFKRRR